MNNLGNKEKLCPNCKMGYLLPRWGEEFSSEMWNMKVRHCPVCGAAYKELKNGELKKTV